VAYRCATLLINDLCQMARCEPPEWLKFKAVHNDTQPLRILSLEILDAVLSEHAWVFSQYHQMSGLICTQVCPLIQAGLLNPDTEKFHILVRLVRISCSILELAMDEDCLVDPCKALLGAIISFVDLACTSIPPNANFSQHSDGYRQDVAAGGSTSSTSSFNSKTPSWLGPLGKNSTSHKGSNPNQVPSHEPLCAHHRCDLTFIAHTLNTTTPRQVQAMGALAAQLRQ
jgi:hypothetical protein